MQYLYSTLNLKQLKTTQIVDYFIRVTKHAYTTENELMINIENRL